MHAVKIGILGYGGKIGSYLVESLSLAFSLRLGQRNLTPIERTENVEFMEVDIFVQKSLNQFVNGLDILVNCAGPSYRIKGIVAEIAAQQGIAYVDAFGGEIVEQCLKEREGSFILSAGSFPGFSGILPLYIAKQYFDRVQSFHLFSNNNEPSSYSAAYDLILSSLQHFGKSGYYYSNHGLVASKSISTEWLGFEKNNYYYDYINHETIQVAKQLNVEEAHWINVYSNKKQSNLIKEITIECLKKENQERIDQLLSEAIRESEVSQNWWYKIACEMIGYKNNVAKKAYVFLEFPNSYLLGSEMIKEVVEALYHRKKEVGTIWTYAYLDPIKTMTNLLANGVIKTIQFNYETIELHEEGEF